MHSSIYASGQDVAGLQGIEPAEIRLVRIHGEEAAAGEGIEEIDGPVVFAEAPVIVQVAGSVAHGSVRVHPDPLGQDQDGHYACQQSDDDNAQYDFYGFFQSHFDILHLMPSFILSYFTPLFACYQDCFGIR